MRMLLWLVALAAVCGVAYVLWRLRERWLERQRAAEERLASFVAQAKPAVAPVQAPAAAPRAAADNSLPQQKLLFEAAAKAGEAGEAALSIQLYARLLARYPQSAFAAQARAAVETQKTKLAKA